MSYRMISRDRCAKFEYELFVMHAEVDGAFVHGYLLSELGLPPDAVLLPDDFVIGRPIAGEIERAVISSRATIAVLSYGYMADRWAVFGEQLATYAQIASEREHVLLPLLRTDCDLPGHIRALVQSDFRDSNRDAWHVEASRLRGILRCSAVRDPEPVCPYPGLRAFTENDASRFFGRQIELDDVVGRIRRGEREVYVIGPSGSGKTSLIAAGLVPMLTVARSPAFLVRTLRPGDRPFTRLAQVLEGDLTNTAAAISALLARHRASCLLLVVDQLEELFSVVDEAERACFLATISSLRMDGRCVLVFALRADFFGAFMDSELWMHSDRAMSRLEVGPLRRGPLRTVIEQPARVLNVHLEPDLVERLLNDAALEPGALPLLQETLVQLWNRRRQGFLALADYEAMGDGARSGLALAISARADTTLRKLTHSQIAVARRIMLRLVTFGEGRADTRRQQSRAALRSIAEQTADFDTVLRRLVGDRIVTTTSDEDCDVVRVDLAHEVLIQAWPTFAGWIHTWRAHEQHRRALEGAAATWIKRGRGDGGLLDQVELAAALAWHRDAATQLGESPNLVAFVDASRSAHARAAKQQRRRIRLAFLVLVAFLTVTSSLGLLALYQRSRVANALSIARSERGHAEIALTSAEKRKRELVLLQAETALAKDPTATLAWLKSYDIGSDDRRKIVDMIDEALALGVARHVYRTSEQVLDAQFTPDGKTVVAAVHDGTLHIYNLVNDTETVLGEAPSQPEVLALTPDGALAITGGSTGEVIAWPLHGGSQRRLLDGSGRMVEQLHISPDGRLVLVERESSVPEVVSLAGGEPAVLGPRIGLHFAVAAKDWSRVAMMTAANEVAIPGDGTAPARLLAHTERAISFLALSPSGDTVVIHDGATIWTVPFVGGMMHKLIAYSDKIVALAWSPDARTIAIGGHRPEIMVVNATTGEATELRGHTDALYTLEFTRDGQRLLSASDDATARIWRLATQSSIVLRGHDDDVYHARFSADERSVATSSLDGSTRVWLLETPSTAVYLERGSVEGMRLDHDQLLVRSTSSVARWDLASGRRDLVSSWADELHNLGYGVPAPDGEHVVVPNADGTMELRATSGARIVLRGHRGLITHIDFARDSKIMFSSSSDGALRRWDVATGEGSALLETTTPIRGFAVARDGRIAVQAGEFAYLVEPGGRVTKLGKGGIWCIEYAEFEPLTDRLLAHRCDHNLAIVDGDHQIALATGGYTVSRISVSPDGRWVAGGLVDRTIRLWSMQTGQVMDVLRGHTDLVMDVAFSPDGTRLASASYDNTVRLWDLTTKRHRVLRGHTAPVGRVVWRDGQHLVSGAWDATIRVWDAPNLELPTPLNISRLLDAATTARIAVDRPSSRPSSANEPGLH